MSRPYVTIGMSFRNEAGTIDLAIRSILAQSFTDWELLLWDDGSSDCSLSIARGFTDPRIHVFSDGVKRALSTRMNACVAAARGCYFARMDADDISYPDRLLTEVKFMDEHTKVDLVSTHVAIIDENGELLGKMGGPTVHSEIVKRALLGFRMSHPAWLGRASWFRANPYRPDAIYAQDQDLLYRAHKTSQYAVIPEMLLAWRQDPLRMSKLIRARTVWFKHVSRYLQGWRGTALKCGIGAVLCCKVAVDLLAVGSGLGYRILRHRARPVSARERRAYYVALDEIKRLTSSAHVPDGVSVS